MVLVYKKYQLNKKVKGKGMTGTLMKSMNGILTKKMFNKLAKSLVRGAVTAVGTYGANKLLGDPSSSKNITTMGNEREEYTLLNDPALTMAPSKQGVIQGDILPVRNTLEYVNPMNHTIDLPGNVEKPIGALNNNTGNQVVQKRKRVPGSGMSKKAFNSITDPALEQILNNKSKQILNGIIGKKGSGLFNFH